MGYDIWHEFYHPKYGTLCFLAHDVGNPLFGFEGDWYLIPSGCSEFGFHEIHRPVSGLDLTELLEYVKEVDNEQVSSEI